MSWFLAQPWRTRRVMVRTAPAAPAMTRAGRCNSRAVPPVRALQGEDPVTAPAAQTSPTVMTAAGLTENSMENRPKVRAHTRIWSCMTAMEAAGQVQNSRAGTEQSFNGLLAKGCPGALSELSEGPREAGIGQRRVCSTAQPALGGAGTRASR